MRILISAYAFSPDSGSEPGVGWNWAKALSEDGHLVTVITRYGQYEGDLNVLCSRLNIEILEIDINIFEKAFKPTTIFHYLIWQAYAYLLIRISVKKFDVVHHVTYGSMQGGSWLWNLRTPFIFGPIGGGQITPSFAKPLFSKRQWFFERLRSLLTAAQIINPILGMTVKKSRIVLVTNRETELFIKKFNARTIVRMIDSGVPSDIVRHNKEHVAKIRSGRLRILWIGRIMPRKGLLIAIRSIKLLKFDAELIIVGDGDGRRDAEKTVQDLDLQDKVKFLGRIPHSEVFEECRKSDVFLFTSVRDSFGSQLLEAASQGLPIIALDLGGVSNIPDEATVKIDCSNGNLDEIITRTAQAIELFNNMTNEEVSKMSKSATEFAHSNSWHQRSKTIQDLYEEVIK